VDSTELKAADFVPVVDSTELKAADFVPVVDSTGENVSLHIHKQNAESDQSDDTRIYQLAKSPIRFNKVEEYVITYPRKYEVI
jgi:hypothetical protein